MCLVAPESAQHSSSCLLTFEMRALGDLRTFCAALAMNVETLHADEVTDGGDFCEAGFEVVVAL